MVTAKAELRSHCALIKHTHSSITREICDVPLSWAIWRKFGQGSESLSKSMVKSMSTWLLIDCRLNIMPRPIYNHLYQLQKLELDSIDYASITIHRNVTTDVLRDQANSAKVSDIRHHGMEKFSVTLLLLRRRQSCRPLMIWCCFSEQAV